MSEILIGADATPLPDTTEKKAKQIPEPSGYRILCMVPEVEDKFDSGLIKADTTVYAEERFTGASFASSMTILSRA